MKKTIRDFEISGKKVIIRCDLNVPIKDGKIYDDNRIKMSLDTIKYAIDHDAKVIILSHMGRIKNVEDKNKYSLEIVSKKLEKLLNKKVLFISETRGFNLEKSINEMKDKDIILVENTRFEDLNGNKESSNDKELSKYWANLGDIFINDAFATSHRSHASNVGIASNLPSGIGFLVEKEIKSLEYITKRPDRPLVSILGGAKMKDKIKVISELAQKSDYLLLAGGIANTFLKALGHNIGKSIYDEESIKICEQLYEKYKEKIILPKDFYATNEYKNDNNPKYCILDEIPDDMMALDIGNQTVKEFEKYIKKSNSLFMNGPVGVSEFPGFSYGTRELFKYIKSSQIKAVIGGGDSAAAAINFGYKNYFYHISTGGGASIEFVEGNILPAIDIIDEKYDEE